jgi:hypothetical protein
MYETPHSVFYQGDVANSIRFQFPGGADFVSPGMIITQTCDIGHRDYIHVCPVITFESHMRRAKESHDEQNINDANSLLGSIRSKNKDVFYMIYLPPYSNPATGLTVEESYIDLTSLSSISPDQLSLDDRAYSLSDKGRHMLVFFLLYF